MVKIIMDRNSPIGFGEFDFSDIDSKPTSIDVVSSKKISIEFKGGTSIEVGGSGFLERDGIPYAGKVTSIDFQYKGMPAVTFEGLKANVGQLAAIIKSGDFSGVNDLIEDALGKRDFLQGGLGDDTFKGFDGDDKLYGREGNDTLSGGHGDDTFVFATGLDSEKNVDTITDFNRYGDDDTFEMRQSTFKGMHTGKLTKKEFLFITDPTEIDGYTSKHRILYDKKDGDLYYDRDGNGDKYGLVKFAEVKANASVDHTDFFTL